MTNKKMYEEEKLIRVQNLSVMRNILLKIANGIGNTDCGYSLLDFARIGGCESSEIRMLKNFLNPSEKKSIVDILLDLESAYVLFSDEDVQKFQELFLKQYPGLDTVVCISEAVNFVQNSNEISPMLKRCFYEIYDV